MITGFYVALLALMQIGLTLAVVQQRRTQKVSLGTDKGDWHLIRAVRAHGNFTEIVPMAVLVILLAELQGAPLWAVHSLGILLVLGRILHAYAIFKCKYSTGMPRVVGIVLNLFVLLLGGLVNLWLAIPSL